MGIETIPFGSIVIETFLGSIDTETDSEVLTQTGELGSLWSFAKDVQFFSKHLVPEVLWNTLRTQSEACGLHPLPPRIGNREVSGTSSCTLTSNAVGRR